MSPKSADIYVLRWNVTDMWGKTQLRGNERQTLGSSGFDDLSMLSLSLQWGLGSAGAVSYVLKYDYNHIT